MNVPSLPKFKPGDFVFFRDNALSIKGGVILEVIFSDENRTTQYSVLVPESRVFEEGDLFRNFGEAFAEMAKNIKVINRKFERSQ